MERIKSGDSIIDIYITFNTRLSSIIGTTNKKPENFKKFNSGKPGIHFKMMKVRQLKLFEMDKEMSYVKSFSK